MKHFSLSIIAGLLSVAASAQFTAISTAPKACLGTCTTSSTIDVCPANGSTVVSIFQNGSHISGTGNSAGTTAGSQWRYRNVAVIDGQTVNAIVTVDEIYHAVLDNIDDDAAVDQNNNSIGSYFAPRIGPDQNLRNTSRQGYVQFTVAFFKNSTGTNSGNNTADFAVSVSLTDMNYVHYDIDGNAENSNNANAAWFRETGVAKRITTTNPSVLANASTELVPYTYNASSGADWTGFGGSVCERDGVSRCSEVIASFKYTGAQPSITFRMGYDFKADNNGYNVGSPVRQYGSRLGCFFFPQQTTLPLRLLSFNGAYRNGIATLNWTTDNETNFSKFDIERSTDGTRFSVIGTKYATGSASARANYELLDDLNAESASVFYYRLKMIDADGKFTYSQIVVLRKENKGIMGVILSPNPVVNGFATVRMTAAQRGSVELRVVDQAGRVVVRQAQQVYEGNNSITLQVQHLQSGIYTLQILDGEALLASKFSVVR